MTHGSKTISSGTVTGAAEAPAYRMDVGLFAVSACVLTLQVLQTKIFAYSLDHLTIYLAISVCMLGLGASATLLALMPPVTGDRARHMAAAAAAAGALAVLVAHLVFAAHAWTLHEGGIPALLTLIALILPYFCFGLVIAFLLVARAESVGRAYAFNLAGSGLGCVVVFPLLDALGAERAVVCVSIAALATAALLARPRARAASGLAVVGLVVAGAFIRAPDLLDFPPEYSGQLNSVLRVADHLRVEYPDETVYTEHLFKRWDRTARVDVYRIDTTIDEHEGRPSDTLFFVQDASAGSLLLNMEEDVTRTREFFERTVYGAGYARGAPGDVLIIGLGGAPDVQAAIYFGAERIVGIEINRSTIDIVREEFAAHLGRPYEHPNVTIHQVDGRTFLRSSEDLFGLIQLSGVDTKAVLAAGSLSLNENYMYTREAMGEMLRRLRPDGIVAITRFGDRDLHRLASVAVAGLRDVGEEHPQKHLFAIQQGSWRSLIVRRTPFPQQEVELLHAWVGARGNTLSGVRIPPYSWIGLGLDQALSVRYSPEPLPVAGTEYFKALLGGKIDEFIASTEDLDLTASVDDRPFFFFYERPWPALKAVLSGEASKDSSSQSALLALHRLLAQLGLVAVVFILAPLAAFRSRGLRVRGSARTMCYFSCLGMAFMFVEIGLIQKFVLLLGHQSYAISVVLLGLLVGASVGSSWSARLDITSRRPIGTVIGVLAATILVYALVLGTLFEVAAGAPFWLRMGLALALLVTLGMLMGVPFPTALRALRAEGLPFAAWAIGINGFASVIGSMLALEVAMLVGLRALLLASAVLYIAAALTAPFALRSVARR